MDFTSLSFLGFVLLAVLLSNAFPGPRARAYLLCCANLAFIASFVTKLQQLLPISVFLLIAFALIELVRKTRSQVLATGGVVLLVGSFVVLKRYSFIAPSFTLPFPYLLIGLSYVLFRVLHLLIDAKQGELTEPIPALHFFNYTCNFLTFVAGPIQRYEEYRAQSERRLALDEAGVFAAFARVIRGYLKLLVVSASFNYLFETLSTQLLLPERAAALGSFSFAACYALSAIFYTVHLYANFAGYVDIVIGVGRLMGQELPENFNHPFQARNFLDFWSRWHMTLSEWFKTYVFNPLLTALSTRVTSRRAAPYLGVFAFFVTFLIMGIWHGSTSVFVAYGLLLGAGASTNKLWQTVLSKRLGKQRYRALCERPLHVYAARGLTAAYFSFALTCLWVDLGQLLAVLRHTGPALLLASYVSVAAGAAAVFYGWDLAQSKLKVLREHRDSAAHGLVFSNGSLALQVMFIAVVASFFHKAPEFVYRAF